MTTQGHSDKRQITKVLLEEDIDTVISSPYKRAVLTVQELAERLGQRVLVIEDLKERVFIREEKRIDDKELLPLIRTSFSDPNFSFPEAESNKDCQRRAMEIIKGILKIYRGQKVVIGTHAVIMTLVMGYYDSKYDLDFLLHISKPDIYRMEFDGEELVKVDRLWRFA
ncbi:histidine phosphatase family protein [Paucisalibacillus globulus]|uniref:histidine phosphatase family protein n=1 Tax=Paucisalibacillus globulus TaxID=351095 RepID=UPI001FE05313|nr:histidine phosphatase family protein [Paucisalibacillus globulus]